MPARSLQLVYFQSDRGGNLDIWVTNADGSGTPTQLTTYAGNDQDPFVAKDGRIVFHSNRSGPTKIWVMDADGGNARQVSDTSSTADQRPSVADDGWVYFDSTRPGANNEICRSHLDGDGTVYVLTAEGVNALTPAVTRDGSYVAYGSARAGSTDLWVLPLDGSRAAFIAHSSAADDGAPDWGE